MTDCTLREAAQAIVDHDLFYDREYLSSDLNAKLDALRAALLDAQPAPDAVAGAAKVLMNSPAAMKTLVDFQLRHSASASDKARSMRYVQMTAALRTLANGHQP